MARLIDADDALERLKKAEQEMKVVPIVCYKAVPMDGVIEFLRTRPTVDAVEVVRCRDCKRCFKHTTKRNRQYMWICMRNDTDLYVRPDDFCSYGERKEGDD